MLRHYLYTMLLIVLVAIGYNQVVCITGYDMYEHTVYVPRDYSSIQDAIDNLGSNTIINVLYGVYSFSIRNLSTITINGSLNTVVENGLIAYSRDIMLSNIIIRERLIIKNSTHITLENITLESYSKIIVYGVTGIVVRNISIEGSRVHNAIEIQCSRQIVIEYNTITRSVDPVNITSSNNIIIRYNDFRENKGYTIVFTTSRDIIVYGNNFIDNDIDLDAIDNNTLPKLYSSHKIYYRFKDVFIYNYIGNYWSRNNCTYKCLNESICSNYTLTLSNNQVVVDKYPLAHPIQQYVFYGIRPPYVHVLVNKNDKYVSRYIDLTVYTRQPVALEISIIGSRDHTVYTHKCIVETKDTSIRLNIENISDGVYRLLTKIDCIGYNYESYTLLYIDNKPPMITILYPRNNGSVPTIFTLRYNYSDRFYRETVIEVRGLDNSFYKKIGNGLEKAIELRLEPGRYIIMVVGYDEAGHKGIDKVLVEVHVVEKRVQETPSRSEGVPLMYRVIILAVIMFSIIFYLRDQVAKALV